MKNENASKGSKKALSFWQQCRKVNVGAVSNAL
jgi:hypothetical protein